ncbi:hypothetical protein [Algibacter sp. 2305UL17-15]|uniref:LVIVD repeat-containing protein n=1 Tax=Algibacter sp. 2305UL17-15 TaxID=3231268 RepID=UPI0034591C58
MKSLLIILSLLFFVSCSSNDDTTESPPIGTEVVFASKWEQEIPAFLPQGMVYDKANRPYFYLAAKGGGLLIFSDQKDDKPTQVANVPIGDLKGLHAMHIFQKGNYLYLALGDFFDGKNGAKSGLAIVNISDPKNPVVEDTWESDDFLAGSAIVIVEGNYAYLGAMEYGFFIFDISDPKSIIETSDYTPNKNYPVENPDSAQIPNARGMSVVGNKLYLCYDAGGIRIIDISNKELPNEIGKFHNFESIENTPKAYNNIIINGNLAYCAVDYCGVEIWDISDINTAKLIGWWNPWECQSLNNLWWNSPGHANQMVYDAENELLFVNTGRSDLSVLDVSSPTDPILKNSFGAFDDQQATWGMTMKDNDIYLLYIKAAVPLYSNWSGIKKIIWSFE